MHPPEMPKHQMDRLAEPYGVIPSHLTEPLQRDRQSKVRYHVKVEKEKEGDSNKQARFESLYVVR